MKEKPDPGGLKTPVPKTQKTESVAVPDNPAVKLKQNNRTGQNSSNPVPPKNRTAKKTDNHGMQRTVLTNWKKVQKGGNLLSKLEKQEISANG